MKKIIQKYKNYHPSKWEALTFLLIPIFIGLLTSMNTDNDIWFLINTGKYILKNRFPTVDPFSFHQGLHLVVQQWIPDVLFYKIFELFSKTGIYLFVNLVNIYIVFITYKLLMLVSNKKRNLSVLITGIICTIFSLQFTYARPHILSSAIFITELYFLEKYFKTDNYKCLFILPFLSILLINTHASMWLMFFCLWIPFLLNTFKFKIGKIESSKKNNKSLFISFIISFICGIINPYGLKSMSYIFTSYGVYELNEMITEMNAINIHTTLGLLIFIIIFLVFIIYLVFNRKNIQARHFFLLLGTTYLALSAYRGYLFFLIAAIYPLAIYFEENFYVIKERANKKYFLCLIITSIFLIFIPITIIIKNNYISFDNPAKNGIDTIAKIEKNEKELKIYCTYGICNYAEYLNMKLYIDSRAEVFLKANNKKEDIFKEYFKLQNNQLNYKEFLDKYNFDYLIIVESDYLYQLMLNNKNDNYEMIYKDIILVSNYKRGFAKEGQQNYIVLKKVD